MESKLMESVKVKERRYPTMDKRYSVSMYLFWMNGVIIRLAVPLLLLLRLSLFQLLIT